MSSLLYRRLRNDKAVDFCVCLTWRGASGVAVVRGRSLTVYAVGDTLSWLGDYRLSAPPSSMAVFASEKLALGFGKAKIAIVSPCTEDPYALVVLHHLDFSSAACDLPGSVEFSSFSGSACVALAPGNGYYLIVVVGGVHLFVIEFTGVVITNRAHLQMHRDLRGTPTGSVRQICIPDGHGSTPVIAVLHSKKGRAWTARLGATARGNVSLAVWSLGDSSASLIWRAEDLPHDSYRVHCLRGGTDGALVISPNAICRVGPCAPARVVGLNSNALETVPSSLTIKMSDLDGATIDPTAYARGGNPPMTDFRVSLVLATSRSAFVDTNTLLVCGPFGELLEISDIAGALQTRVVGSLKKASSCACEIVESPLVFFGSRLGESHLIKASKTNKMLQSSAQYEYVVVDSLSANVGPIVHLESGFTLPFTSSGVDSTEEGRREKENEERLKSKASREADRLMKKSRYTAAAEVLSTYESERMERVRGFEARPVPKDYELIACGRDVLQTMHGCEVHSTNGEVYLKHQVIDIFSTITNRLVVSYPTKSSVSEITNDGLKASAVVDWMDMTVATRYADGVVQVTPSQVRCVDGTVIELKKKVANADGDREGTCAVSFEDGTFMIYAPASGESYSSGTGNLPSKATAVRLRPKTLELVLLDQTCARFVLKGGAVATAAETPVKKEESVDVSKLKVAELRVELEKRGLDTKGLKAVLTQRLSEALEGAAAPPRKRQNAGSAYWELDYALDLPISNAPPTLRRLSALRSIDAPEMSDSSSRNCVLDFLALEKAWIFVTKDGDLLVYAAQGLNFVKKRYPTTARGRRSRVITTAPSHVYASDGVYRGRLLHRSRGYEECFFAGHRPCFVRDAGHGEFAVVPMADSVSGALPPPLVPTASAATSASTVLPSVAEVDERRGSVHAFATLRHSKETERAAYFLNTTTAALDTASFLRPEEEGGSDAASLVGRSKRLELLLAARSADKTVAAANAGNTAEDAPTSEAALLLRVCTITKSTYVAEDVLCRTETHAAAPFSSASDESLVVPKLTFLPEASRGDSSERHLRLFAPTYAVLYGRYTTLPTEDEDSLLFGSVRNSNEPPRRTPVEVAGPPLVGLQNYAVGLVRGPDLETPTCDRINLSKDERALGLRVVYVSDPENATAPRREMVVVSTGYVPALGESTNARGRVVLCAIGHTVDEEDVDERIRRGRPSSTPRLSIAAQFETVGPITAVDSLQGMVLAAVGNQPATVKLFKWDPRNAAAQLVVVGFFDIPFCVVSVAVVKDAYVLVSDVKRSMFLLRWHNRAFELLARVDPTDDPSKLGSKSVKYHCAKSTGSFFFLNSTNKELSCVAIDEDGTVKAFSIDSDTKSLRRKFFLSSTFGPEARFKENTSGMHSALSFASRRRGGNVVVRGLKFYESTAIGSTSGAIDQLSTIPTHLYKRLATLEVALRRCASNDVDDARALYGYAVGASTERYEEEQSSRDRPVDGTLVWAFKNLSKEAQNKVAHSVGTTAESVLETLSEIEAKEQF